LLGFKSLSFTANKPKPTTRDLKPQVSMPPVSSSSTIIVNPSETSRTPDMMSMLDRIVTSGGEMEEKDDYELNLKHGDAESGEADDEAGAVGDNDADQNNASPWWNYSTPLLIWEAKAYPRKITATGYEIDDIFRHNPLDCGPIAQLAADFALSAAGPQVMRQVQYAFGKWPNRQHISAVAFMGNWWKRFDFTWNKVGSLPSGHTCPLPDSSEFMKAVTKRHYTQYIIRKGDLDINEDLLELFVSARQQAKEEMMLRCTTDGTLQYSY
jgi:hypothetical protein